ncbi:MAG: P-loop NTPase [Alistipes sp.]
MQSKINKLLSVIVHPETGVDIVSGHNVENVSADDDKIVVALRFAKRHDPFALKIKSRVEQALAEAFPEHEITVFVKEGEAPARNKAQEAIEELHANTSTTDIGKVIAIASGKGGVGKSTVTANLALALRNMGYSVGVLDADIYGPSQAKMFGAEDYLPDAVQQEGREYIVPAERMGVKVMSIAMFIRPTDALLWRGTMANSALRQLVHQTLWGRLDYLLIDLPPGTGDIHLSIINELHIDGAVIVSTPQQVAVADVVRGVEMFRNPNVGIPVLGIIENMAWFTPKELPDNRYYIFGRGGAARYAAEAGVEVLGEIPIVQSIMQGSDDGVPAVATDSEVEKHYREAALKIIEGCSNHC